MRNLLQGTAMLEFWETYENQEVYQYLLAANQKIKEMQGNTVAPVTTDSLNTAATEVAPADTSKTESSLLEEMAGTSKYRHFSSG